MKSFAGLVAFALTLVSTIDAAPAPQGELIVGKPGPVKPPVPAVGRCKKPIVRKEWRTLTIPQRKSYIKAVNCLQNEKKGKLTKFFPGAVTRYEDFISEHKSQTPYIHLVGHFLPWHRLFLAEFENVLRKECKYDGALPYWDYSLDHNDVLSSPVFDPVHGFGGNGVTPTGEPPEPFTNHCIQTGPFANWTIHTPQLEDTGLLSPPRCLERAVWQYIATYWLSPEVEADILSKTYFGDMSRTLEGEVDFALTGMHGAGHFVIGGSASDAFTSNTEPIFYLHHTNLDRIWWEWQAADYESRLWDISGSIIPRDPFFGGNFTDLPTGNVTLDFNIHLGNLNPSKNGHVKISQVMDLFGGRQEGKPGHEKGVLCYNYDTTPEA